MRVAILVVFVLANACGSAFAQDLFRGVFSIVSENKPCPEASFVGDYGFIRLKVGAGGEGSAFTLYQDDIAQAFRLGGGTFGSDYQRVDSLSAVATFSATNSPIFVRFSEQKPAVIRSNTSFVSLTGQIRGYQGTRKCIVTFRASLARNFD
jgi:hypothetical protein